jgi:YetA-like protein
MLPSVLPRVELSFSTAFPAGGRRGEPVTCGVPWPRGVLTDPSLLWISDSRGQAPVLQTRILDRWPDGSVRWLLLDWQATVLGTTTCTLFAPGIPGQPVGARLQLEERDGELVIETGTARFRLRAGGRFPFESVTVGNVEVIDASRSGFRIEDDKGTRYSPNITELVVEEIGPVRASVRLTLGGKGDRLADLVARLHFFAGSATVRFVLTITNPRKADHPGGLWDLGNGGSIYLRDASLVVTLPTSFEESTVRASVEMGQTVGALALPIEIYQDSSGGENWKGSNHVNRRHEVPNSFRGCRIRSARRERTDNRATPFLELTRGARCVSAAMPYFWQNFPKALEADEGTLTLRLFPRQYADVHELQGGEQKTHTFYLAFAPDNVCDQPMDWCRNPLVVTAPPRWYCESGVLPYLTPRNEDPHPEYLRLVDAAIEGDDTFEKKRELVDEYGWRHFGDIYGDHEGVYHSGPGPLASHYNNQYDPVAGFAYQFLRSGDVRWWRHMCELARHVIDIDIYHTDLDKAAYNHGLFWHTYHYVDADTATHRTYPRAHASRVHGGGPANEHNYGTGLSLHYFLTGDPASREAVLGLAQWVIDMDDGSKSPFRWLDAGPTGLASKSRTEDYHGPGRGSANSVAVLLDGHRLSGDERFLAKAEELIRRVIHPADDVPARNLLDAENRWFYVMFLQALGRYLDYKAELGQLDEHYAFVRASLLHYARWMADNEYPYLDKHEILEYPNETWPAQDMRKSDVFKYAALHAEGAERARFLERAEFFFRYSVTKLTEMPTRTLARPVVLMLSFGFMQAWFAKHPDAAAPPAAVKSVDFGKPVVFVPQKVRAKRRFAMLAVAGVAMLAGIGAVAAYLILR